MHPEMKKTALFPGSLSFQGLHIAPEQHAYELCISPKHLGTLPHKIALRQGTDGGFLGLTQPERRTRSTSAMCGTVSAASPTNTI